MDFTQLAMPVLVVSTQDDRFGTTQTARDIAAQLPKGCGLPQPSGRQRGAGEQSGLRLDDGRQSRRAVGCVSLLSAADSQTDAMLSCRQFGRLLPEALAATGTSAGCASSDGEAYPSAVQQTRRLAPLGRDPGTALGAELVRCATLAPSNHNTQCWKFAAEKKSFPILPDFSRRCTAVDPDDDHLFVSLGCAAENLIQAARAHGLHGEAEFDKARGASASSSPLRPKFADAVDLGRTLKDLAIRIGRGPMLRLSLRRPVQAVLV